MSEQQGHIAEALGKISKFFGWIAGILAGVSAMLSVAGFMLLKSHAHLLGLSGVFHHSVQDYLYQGGNFFISTLFWALPVSIFGNTYIRILAAIVALYLLGRRIGLFTSIIQRLNASETFQQPWVRWIIILAAAILFIMFINAILPPPEAKDLLFATGRHPEIAKRPTPDAITALKNQYILSILYVLISAFILWGINRIHYDPEKKSSSTLLYVCSWLTGISSEHQSQEKPPKHRTNCFLPSVVCSSTCCSLCNSCFCLSSMVKPSIPIPSTGSQTLFSTRNFRAKFPSHKTFIY